MKTPKCQNCQWRRKHTGLLVPVAVLPDWSSCEDMQVSLFYLGHLQNHAAGESSVTGGSLCWKASGSKCIGLFPTHLVCLLRDGTVVARPWSCLPHHAFNSPLSTRSPACPSCSWRVREIFWKLAALRPWQVLCWVFLEKAGDLQGVRWSPPFLALRESISYIPVWIPFKREPNWVCCKLYGIIKSFRWGKIIKSIC